MRDGPRTFVDARAKLSRAHVHLTEILRLAREIEDEPTHLEFVDGECLVWKAITQPSVDLALLIGDFAHNARACLDYAVYELSMRHRGRRPKSSGFPIFVDPDDFVCRGKPRIRSLSVEAQQAIAEMQPYGTWEHAVSLRHLNVLVNIDKHRHIPLTVRRTGGVEFGNHRGRGEDMLTVTLEDHPDRAIARVQLRPGSDVHFDARLATFVTFDDFPGGKPLAREGVVGTLGQIHGVLGGFVLPRLEAFLPHGD